MAERLLLLPGRTFKIGWEAVVEHVTGVGMNRTELLARLRDASIDPRSYDLAEGRWENYVLHEGDGCWEVFYFERGIKVGLRTFAHEVEANMYFFDLVLDDPTTRLT